MGQQLVASCPCGYQGRASVGSSRRDHGKVFSFPHHCQSCTQVVSGDVLASELKCPKCASSELIQYGVKIPESPRTWGGKLLGLLSGTFLWNELALSRLRRNSIATSYCFVHHATYGVTRGKYCCPKCSTQVMVFSVGSFFS